MINGDNCLLKKIKMAGFGFSPHAPQLVSVAPFPCCNDDGMAHNHLIIVCFWGRLHLAYKGKGRTTPIHTVETCFQGNSQVAAQPVALRIKKRLPIPHAACQQPWHHQWKLLSCDSPVSVCLCPLIRDLIYSQLSSLESAEWGSIRHISSIIDISISHIAAFLESDSCYMKESVTHAVRRMSSTADTFISSILVLIFKVIALGCRSFQELVIGINAFYFNLDLVFQLQSHCLKSHFLFFSIFFLFQ